MYKHLLGLLLTTVTINATAAPLDRPLLPSCQTTIDTAQLTLANIPDELSEASWNRYYSGGQSARIQGDLWSALDQMCLALYQARNFDARDWRFAETLDELGHINYLLEQYNDAELAQGAAVAEMLLTAGPKQTERMRRNVKLFIERLGLVYEQQGRSELTTQLIAAPQSIFDMGYIPLDQDLARRLDWLASEYLGLEQFDVANELLSLIAELDQQQY